MLNSPLQAIQPVTNANEITDKVKVRLTVPLVASYLSRGIRQSDIARACNLHTSTVSKYIKTNYDKLGVLIDNTDGLMAMASKHVANMALGRLDNILEHTENFDKKDLVALNIVSGTQIDKYRLLSDKSTSNVAIDTCKQSLEDLNKREQDLLKKLECVRKPTK